MFKCWAGHLGCNPSLDSAQAIEVPPTGRQVVSRRMGPIPYLIRTKFGIGQANRGAQLLQQPIEGNGMKRTVAAAVAGVALVAALGLGVASATGSGPAGRIAQALSGLVSNGTITQAQADAVGKALEDAHSAERKAMDAHRKERMTQVDGLLSDTLGLTRAELHERIKGGDTLREVAGDKANALVTAALDLVKKDLAQDVTDGRLTQSQADKMLARAEAAGQSWLDGKDVGRGLGMLLGGGPGRGGPGHRGHGPGDWDGSGGAGERY
jgi:hypothetical protein